MTQLINKTNETGKRTRDFIEVVMMSERRRQKLQASDHRNISLIRHKYPAIAKIVARLLRRRIEKKIEDEL